MTKRNDDNSHKVTDYFSREEIRDLRQTSNWQGIASLGVSWAVIAGSFALVAQVPHVLTILLALVLIGGRQLALAILMHECAHRSLFRSPWMNRVFGHWLIAAPVWQDLERYREHHIRHHTNTNRDTDPDLGLVTGFPTTSASLLRKFARDLTGISGLKRIVALLAMDLGLLSYTASTGAKRLHPSLAEMFRNGLRRTGPVLLTNALLFAGLWGTGHPELYALWIIAYLTTFSLFVRIRAMAEHAQTERSDNPLRNTRTTKANLFARLTVAPHHVNYHLEHHLLMTVPHYRLRKMHKMMRSKGLIDEHNTMDGYLQVISAMRST